MDNGFSFADVFEDVVDRAGGPDATANDVTKVRRGLQILLTRWENLGYNTWRIRNMRAVAMGYENYIDLPPRVDDVISVNHDPHGGQLTRVTIDEFAYYGSEPVPGTPSSWALMRAEPPRLMLYPAGAGDGLMIWHVERPEHYMIGNSGLDDVPSRWLEAVILGLAHDLASKRPPYEPKLIARLRMSANAAEMAALAADRDRAAFRYRTR